MAQQGAALKQLGAAVEKIGENLTVVTGKEEWKIVLFGELRGEVLYSTARPLIPGAPLLLAPDSPFGLSQDTLDVHGKSTTLGALIMGPQICDFKSGGLIMGALYSETLVEDIYGFLPLQAFGELRSDSWRFAAGLQFDVFNPLMPNMVNFNSLFASGNAGAYRGEVRAEYYMYPGPESQIALQGSIGQPLPTIITDSTLVDGVKLSEDNGWPNVEVRAAWALGPIEGEGPEAKRPFEVGVSGLVGEIRNTRSGGHRVVANVWGVGCDGRWKVTDRFGLQGELFLGETLGSYLGGVSQTVNTITLDGIRAAGAWGEGYFYVTPCVHWHVGYGIDDPLDSDLSPGQIVRNDTYFSTIFYDVTKDFRLGLELSYRETSYDGLLDNEGILIHTQARWMF